MHVMFLSQNRDVLDHPMLTCTTVSGQYYCTLLQAVVNNQNCLSMISFCSRKMQCLIANMTCKVWCNNAAGRCWHIPLTLQISLHVIPGCSHMWKNIFGVNDLNWKVISTLLSWHLYIIWARINTELQLIIYHKDAISVCGQCWWLHGVEDTCVNIQEYE